MKKVKSDISTWESWHGTLPSEDTEEPVLLGYYDVLTKSYRIT